MLVPQQQQPAAEQGGANVNDRTLGGEPGQELLAGAMSVSPSGHYVVMQRNSVSILLDVQAKKYEQLPFRVVRASFLHQKDVAVVTTGSSIVAYDMASKAMLWSVASQPSILRPSNDDSSILAVSGTSLQVIDVATGMVRGTAMIPSSATFANEIPGKNAMLVVGDTSWSAHKPNTPVVRVDLKDASTAVANVPNCNAPIQILPDASRALLSPTFCDEGVQSTASGDTWTNPDPVSVIELANGISFNKNLPGFGPVALRSDGSLAVAYLDTKRMDPSMFDDKSQVPSVSGPEYHLMLIDPKSLAFTLHPIGDALPRFAMTRDGKGLLVDASIKIKTRIKANASGSFSIGPNGISGEVSASAGIFESKSPFGYFDLQSKSFTGFAGVQAGIDRFVQLADGKTVVALAKRTDGLGGIPHAIDLETKTVTALAEPSGSSGVRDIGLLADGKTIVVRVRMPAKTLNGKLYSQEASYLSFDFSAQIDGSFTLFTDSTPFANADPEGCPTGYHDCW